MLKPAEAVNQTLSKIPSFQGKITVDHLKRARGGAQVIEAILFDMNKPGSRVQQDPIATAMGEVLTQIFPASEYLTAEEMLELNGGPALIKAYVEMLRAKGLLEIVNKL